MLKKIFSIAAVVVASSSGIYAQDASFCGTMNTILGDAPNRFKNIRDREMNQGAASQMWSSKVKLTGSVGYRIVSAMGLFYEAAFMQTTDKEKIGPVYEEYKKKLSDCLLPQGYKLSTQENVVAGLSDYSKLVFMKPLEDPKAGDSLKDLPPHVTMEVLFHKDYGFTVVAFIFEH